MYTGKNIIMKGNLNILFEGKNNMQTNKEYFTLKSQTMFRAIIFPL